MRLHEHETDRVESLRSYAVLDTPAEPAYDALTRLAALVCHAPGALLTLVDDNRQWHKSVHGRPLEEGPREIALCNQVVAQDRLLVVSDTALDPLRSRGALTTGLPGVRAYAGVPLVGRDGLPVGALCVLDVHPRDFTMQQLEGLLLLGDQVIALLELRRADRSAGREPSVEMADTTDPVRLRMAFDRGELRASYQPVVDLATGLTVAVEALLRWHHPDRGVLLPAAFLPTIESSGLILPIGRSVLDQALALLTDLRTRGLVGAAFTAGVNASGTELAHVGFAEGVLSALERHGVPTACLSVEITETVPILDMPEAISNVARLREAGVLVALDDYGVGLSTLSRLLGFPVTAVKLDRSLVSDVAWDDRSRLAVRSTCALAADMGVYVVAEGIEAEDDRSALLELGVCFGQGWLFGRALEPKQLVEHLRAQAAADPLTGPPHRGD